MDQLFNLLKGFAPALATAAMGPAGGAIISMVANKLGVSDTVAEVTAALAADPEAGKKMRELDLEYAKMDKEDRDSARQMQIAALQQDDKFAKHFIYWYAWFWSVGTTIYFFCVTFIPMPQGGRDFANIILGFLLGTAVATIISFFYGSSKSSKDKTDALVRELK